MNAHQKCGDHPQTYHVFSLSLFEKASWPFTSQFRHQVEIVLAVLDYQYDIILLFSNFPVISLTNIPRRRHRSKILIHPLPHFCEGSQKSKKTTKVCKLLNIIWSKPPIVVIGPTKSRLSRPQPEKGKIKQNRLSLFTSTVNTENNNTLSVNLSPNP